MSRQKSIKSLFKDINLEYWEIILDEWVVHREDVKGDYVGMVFHGGECWKKWGNIEKGDDRFLNKTECYFCKKKIPVLVLAKNMSNILGKV